MMDPVFAIKGAKVALVRGVTVNTNIGPEEGGPARVQRVDDVVPDAGAPGGWRLFGAGDDLAKRRRRPAVDDEGKPIMVDNPKAPAAAEVSGVPDGNGKIPVKFASGSWGMVRYQDLTLLEKASEQAGDADPVRAREAALRAQTDRGNALADDVAKLRAEALALAVEAASIKSDAKDAVERLGAGIVELHGKLALHEEKVAAAIGEVAREWQRLLADAIAAIMAKVEGQKQPSAPDTADAPSAPSVPVNAAPKA